MKVFKFVTNKLFLNLVITLSGLFFVEYAKCLFETFGSCDVLFIYLIFFVKIIVFFRVLLNWLTQFPS
jgi:hypothetical protein